MTYEIISSGSEGNAVIIDGCILIDCGVPFFQLRPYYKDLKLVLLTHIHTDHFNLSTVRRLFELRPTLRFGCCAWMVRSLRNAKVDNQHIDVYTPGREYSYHIDGNSLRIAPVELTHNVPQCGYKIWLNNESLFYATDTATLEGIRAENFNLYMIECNHHEDEIQERIAEKTAAGEFAYEVRAAQTHLSWEKAMAWLEENTGMNSRFIPMHEHKDKE